MVNVNGRIFLIPTGTAQGYTNRSHFHNFLKYLFSCTAKHPQTDFTQYNYCCIEGDKDSFVDNGMKSYNDFKKKYWDDIQDHTLFAMDLCYVYFLLEVNGKLISNMFNEYGKLDLDNDASEIILKRYFNGEIKRLKDVVKSIISKSGKVKNILLNSADFEDRKVIERCVLETIKDEVKLQNFKVMLSVSHHDQEDSLYHVHRVLKR